MARAAGRSGDSHVLESVRELLLNVVKHAQSERATIAVQVVSDDALRILVADHGRGFDPAAAMSSDPMSSRYGLFSIRERMAVMGGALTLNSAPGKGTTVTIAIPYKREEAAPNPASLSDTRPATSARSVPSPSQAKGDVVRVLLADDHAMVRRDCAVFWIRTLTSP